MKITIEENKQQRSYPYLGKNESGNIVAFTAPKTGVVVLVGSTTKWEQGEVLDVWNESAFTPIHPQPEPEPEPIPVEDRKYPYVGIAKNPEIKVLFTESCAGICIEDLDKKDSNLGFIGRGYIESDFAPIPNISRIIIDLE